MMNLKFEGFKKYNKKPCAITNGYLFTKTVFIPFSKEKKRTLRVWLPMGYDGVKSYPVFYFCDGQNMVDRYTSGYGEWNLEDHVYELQQKGHEGIILVGLDCPLDPKVRESEYMPYLGKENHFFTGAEGEPRLGEEMAKYFVFQIKPLIDITFMSKRGREFTGFGGSSMGGLFSYYIVHRYPKVFSMCLSFSPAFLLYDKSTLKRYVANSKNNDIKTVFFAGRKGKLESEIYYNLTLFYSWMNKYGYDMNQVKLILDKKEIHHESAWSKYCLEAFDFLLS